MGQHGPGDDLSTGVRGRAPRPGVLAVPTEGHRLLTTLLVDALAVARLFDLGRPTAALRRLPGLSGAVIWALDTDRGAWVVKTMPAPDWPKLSTMAASSTLEKAARAAGVLTPRPVEPPASPDLYWAPMDGLYVRVSERLDGKPPTVPPAPEVARWLGTTVATIVRLGLEGEPSPFEWKEPFDRAVLPNPQRRRLRPLLTDMTALVTGALADAPPMVLAHRDINRRNILLTGSGPALLDFDGSAPEVPWWELVHHAVLLACRDLGPEEPDPVAVRTAVAAYADAGGPVGPADVNAFAALVRGLVDWVVSGLGDARVRGQALRSLPIILRSLDRWATLLRP